MTGGVVVRLGFETGPSCSVGDGANQALHLYNEERFPWTWDSLLGLTTLYEDRSPQSTRPKDKYE